MKQFLSFVLFILCSTWCYAQVSNDNEDGVYKIEKYAREYRDGEVIVKFKTTSSAKAKSGANKVVTQVSAVDNVLDALGIFESEELMALTGNKNVGAKAKAYNGKTIVSQDMSKLYRMKFDTSKTQSVYEVIEALKQLDDVEFAEPNYLCYIQASGEGETYTDPLYSQQWAIPAINLDKLWPMPKITSKRPVIAILDTGVDITHPDLAANIWTNEHESDGQEGYDDDRNGFKDDLHGWDFVNQTGNMRDNNGHGTHCAGIAAAVGNNGVGIVGANPDAFIMPITVMQSDGKGDIATIIKGIDYAAANGADIISMSFGTYSTSVAFEQALGKAYATCVLVAAAGNDGHTTDTSSHCYFCAMGGTPSFPAAYTFVLGVEASGNTNGTRAGYSNWDNTGHTYSGYGEEHLYNYELRAPGTNIQSTYPDGRYKSFNGTSMSCPLAAGAISRLLQSKEYDSKELLFGDLIHSCGNGNVDIFATYSIKDSDRHPSLELITYTIDDSPALSSKNDGDGRLDAGETVDIYPVIRNVWGQAKNIKCSISVAENEDPNIITILKNNVSFGHELSSYAKATSMNPIRIKVNRDCVDGRHLSLVLGATCSNNIEEMAQDVVMKVENGVEIGGVITEDMTLSEGVHYIVTKKLAIPQGVTLTIEPGTILKFKDGTALKCEGILNAIGTPEKMIVFTNEGYIGDLTFGNNTIKYCILENIKSSGIITGFLKNCIAKNCYYPFTYASGIFFNCNITNINSGNGFMPPKSQFTNCNIINNISYQGGNFPELISFNASNIWGNKYEDGYIASAKYNTSNISVLRQDASQQNYLGSSNPNVLRNYIIDMNHPVYPTGYGTVDLDYVAKEPIAEAHGVVWKVLVNGTDPQDEPEDMSPLGVGRHRFDVYFNRPMNKEYAPTISMGVRPPYTQVAVAENGKWSSDGKKYTAYLTITGKTNTDGLNRIYVYGAKDDENFEIPEEKYRFKVNVQAAGSMSTGFMGEAGLGKVTLSWEDAQNSFDDFLGYNLYRYTDSPNDSIKVNEQLLDNETLEYVDYDVTPGTTYNYFYKVITTDLKETDKSNVIAVTPQTSTLGDANGSGDVDVADVITTVNYAAGQQPKPFIFEAADMNKDQSIDILDVIGIIKKITNPNANVSSMTEATATYSIENGIVYVDCDAPLAGVQVLLNMDEKVDITTTAELKGFEQTGAWLSDNDYIFLGYNMNGLTLSSGKHAILNIGNATISDIRLSDANGRNIKAIADDTVTKVDNMASRVMTQKGVFTLSGQKVSGNNEMKSLPKGVYIINGQKVIK